MSRRAREFSARKAGGGEAPAAFWWLPEGGRAGGGSARGAGEEAEEGAEGAPRPTTPSRPGRGEGPPAAAGDAAGEERKAPPPGRRSSALAELGELPPPISARGPGPASGSLRSEEDEGEEEDILEAWRRRRHAQLQRLGLTKLALCARESPEGTPPRRSGPTPSLLRRRRLQLDSESSDGSDSDVDGGGEGEGSPPAILAELGTHKEFLRSLSERLGLGVEGTRPVAQPVRQAAPAEDEGGTGVGRSGEGEEGRPGPPVGEPGDASPPRAPVQSARGPPEGGSPVPAAAIEPAPPPQPAAEELLAGCGAEAPPAEGGSGTGACAPPFPPEMLAIPSELSPVLVQPVRPEHPASLLQAQSGLFPLSPPGWATPPRPPTPPSEALRALRASPRQESPMLPSLLDLCSETVADNLFCYESESEAESGGEDGTGGAGEGRAPEAEAGGASQEEGLRAAVAMAAREEVAELISVAAAAAQTRAEGVAAEAASDGEAGSAGGWHVPQTTSPPGDTEERALTAARASPEAGSPRSRSAQGARGTAEEQDEEALLLAEYRGWKEASAADAEPAAAPRLADAGDGAAADPVSVANRSAGAGEEAELLAEYQVWKDHLEQRKIAAPASETAGGRAAAPGEGGGAAPSGEEADDRARGAEPPEEVSPMPSGQPGLLDQLACAELPPELEQVFLADLLGWESVLPAAGPGSGVSSPEAAGSVLLPGAAVHQEVAPADGRGGAAAVGPPAEQPPTGCLPDAADLRRAGEAAATEPLFADDAVVRALTSRLQACLVHLPGEEGRGQ